MERIEGQVDQFIQFSHIKKRVINDRKKQIDNYLILDDVVHNSLLSNRISNFCPVLSNFKIKHETFFCAVLIF